MVLAGAATGYVSKGYRNFFGGNRIMGGSPHQPPEEDYRRWLEALAKAMGTAKPLPHSEREAGEEEAAGPWGFDPSGQEPPGHHFFRTPVEEIPLDQGAPHTNPVRAVSFSSPRVWDLWKPYVMLTAIVLLGGLAGIGSLVWLTQWLIPSSRPQPPTAPVEARWEVRRRGLHILPDPQTAPGFSEPSAQPSASEQSGSEQARSKNPGDGPPFSENSLSEHPAEKSPAGSSRDNSVSEKSPSAASGSETP